MQTATQSIDLPWAAWHGDTVHQLAVPDGCSVDVLAPAGGRALTDAEVRRRLDAPIDAPTIEELARGGSTACIAVDDLARPTRAAEILPHVLERLARGGIAPEHTSIVVATGTHGRPGPDQVRQKVGSRSLEQCRVEVHRPDAGLAGTGIPYGDAELRVNRTFLEADVKISLGCVLPHQFAGFSGGAKMMLPGLADLGATARSHKFVQMGLRGGNEPNENRFRLEIESLARQLGFTYTVAVVTNVHRETIELYAGDLVAAHRAACRTAAAAFQTPVAPPYDCLVLNAYPKDTDLVQAPTALVALRRSAGRLLTERGFAILATCASDGLGQHGLFAPGGTSYRRPAPIRDLAGRPLWVYAPGATRHETTLVFAEDYPSFHAPGELSGALAAALPADARIGVVPCAPMQILASC